MMDTLITALIFIFLLPIVIASYRLIKGPSIPDRMLAIDIVSYTSAVIVALMALLIGSPLLIIVSFSLALWYYIGSLYVARYLEGGEIGD
jgi:multicomponent Na+:H+ antiporter subunit F